MKFNNLETLFTIVQADAGAFILGIECGTIVEKEFFDKLDRFIEHVPDLDTKTSAFIGSVLMFHYMDKIK